jgi:hypothetical protein
MGALLLGFLLLTHFVQPEPDDIPAIAADPYKFARFVNMHPGYDLSPFWKILKIPHRWGRDFNLNCEEGGCKAESIGFRDEKIFGTVVRVDSVGGPGTIFLRFRQQTPNLLSKWRFVDSFEPDSSGISPDHRLITVNEYGFFLVRERGPHGSDLWSTNQHIFDLTEPKFEPVLTYTDEGYEAMMVGGPAREVQAFLANVEIEHRQAITIHRTVRFTANDHVLLGKVQCETVYTREGRGPFRLDPQRSTATARQVSRIYDIGIADHDMDDVDFLRYNFRNLKRIAAQGPDAAQDWLEDFLDQASDIPEKQELQRLLKAARK